MSTLTKQNVAVVIYTDIADDMARVYRALGAAQEFAEAGDDLTIVFDGSGVESLAALSAPDHQLHSMLEGLREHVAGACSFCAKSHNVVDAVTGGGWTLLDDHKGHVSVRALVSDGAQVLNF